MIVLKSSTVSRVRRLLSMGALPMRVLAMPAGWRVLVMLLLLLAAVPSVMGQDNSRWITDEFEVTMRNGKSTKQNIVRMLRSGTRVEMLETDREAGYALVRTAGGAEGWVLTRYLLSAPPARVTMPDLQKRFEANDAKRRELTEKNRELAAKNTELTQRISTLEKSGGNLQQELTQVRQLSANVIQVDAQNKQLSQRLAETEQLLQEMRAENQRLSGRANREWFIVGAAVLAIGVALGLILPRIRWKRKSSWSDF